MKECKIYQIPNYLDKEALFEDIEYFKAKLKRAKTTQERNKIKKQIKFLKERGGYL